MDASLLSIITIFSDCTKTISWKENVKHHLTLNNFNGIILNVYEFHKGI